jgi:predicted dienelactone hydrolase
MIHPDSPAQLPVPKPTPYQKLKTLLRAFSRQTRGFLAAKMLPRLADRACKVYLGDADQSHQAKCRRILRSHVHLDPTQLHHFFHTAVGETLLAWIAGLFHLPGQGGDRADAIALTGSEPEAKKQALRDFLLQMAADSEGFSLLSFMRRFPDGLLYNLDQLSVTAKRIAALLQETNDTLGTIQALAAAEASATKGLDFSQGLDLRQPGAFEVESFFLTFDLPQAQGETADLPPRSRQVLCHRPHPWPMVKAPVILQSHGLAASPEDLARHGCHLASHGYFVAAPWHPGSDAQQARRMLAGESSEMFNLEEFIDRPLDMSHLLDELERRNYSAFGGNLDLQRVGVWGHSFGAYTALALAGACLDFAALDITCGAPPADPNLSLLLQCQAIGLPRYPYLFRDDRIRAIVALDALGSELFGSAGIGQISVPVMLLAGSRDTTAPLVLEQIRLFRWLQTPHAYLVVMQGKSHVQSMQRLTQTLNLRFQVFPQRPSPHLPLPFEHYINALSLAFFQQHLTPNQVPSPYLNARYGAYLSQAPFDLWLLDASARPALEAQKQTRQGVHREP